MAEDKIVISGKEHDNDTLPFSSKQQKALLGHLIMREDCFLMCKDHVEPGWFGPPICALIWEAMLDHYAEHKTHPKVGDIETSSYLRAETQARRNEAITEIGLAQATATNDYSWDPLKAQLETWLKARIFMKGVIDSRDAFNKQQFDKAYTELQNTSRLIRDASFNGAAMHRFNDLEAILVKRKENTKNALTWGLSLFDKMLLPEGNGSGCLLPGATTTLVAPINAGKTTVMQTVAIANILRQKRVLFVIHEGIPLEIQMRFLCCMLNKNIPWLQENIPLLKCTNPTEEQARIAASIRHAQAYLEEYLDFLPIIKQGMTVEEVCSTVRQRHQERLIQDGRGYDLVCDDYPAKLTTVEAQYGKLEYRHKIETVYMGFNRLAEELGFHLLNAAQVNREGNKINKGMRGYEKRLLEMEDFAEAFGPMADTATVITVNRDPMAELQDRVSLHCAKSRTSAKGWTVVCRSRYGNSISHLESLGATCYKGPANGTERLNDLIDKYRNAEIPSSESI